MKPPNSANFTRVGYHTLSVLLLAVVALTAGFAPSAPAAYATNNRAAAAPRAAQAPSQAAQQVAVLVHGWQGGELDPDKYRCSDGIQGPYTADPPEFGELAQTLVDRGFVVYFARWTTSAFRTITAEAAAVCLAAQIQQVKAQDANQQVTLVAHSMGGLVSRAYLESSDYRQDVEQLITFGTPHVGVDLGLVLKLLASLDPAINEGTQLLCIINPGTCELSVDEMLLFDLIHQPTGALPYNFVAGNGAPDWWPLILTELSNDGIVGIRSGVGHTDVFDVPIVRGSRISRWRTGDVHFQGFESLFGTQSYFDGAASIACLNQFVGGTTVDPCVPYAQPNTAPPVRLPERQYTPTISGELAAGETVSFPIRLDGTAAQIVLNWNRGEIDLRLTTPDGASVTPANAAQQLAGGGFARQAGSEWFPTAVYHAQNPAAGEWQATLTATNVVTKTDYALLGSAISPFTLSVEQPRSVAPGQPFTLTARLDNAAAPVAGATVRARLNSTSGTTDVNLPQTGPGVYAANITAPPVAGLYHLSVEADGPAAFPYSRQSDRLLAVRSNDVQLGGTPTVLPVDNNGNGRIDTLRVRVPLVSNRAASYVAGAVLRAGDGTEIARTRLKTNWSTGPQTLELPFDGRSIHAAQLNGPYVVDVQVVAVDTMQRTVDEQSLLQTAAYSFAQFEQTKQQFMPLMRR